MGFKKMILKNVRTPDSKALPVPIDQNLLTLMLIFYNNHNSSKTLCVI